MRRCHGFTFCSSNRHDCVTIVAQPHLTRPLPLPSWLPESVCHRTEQKTFKFCVNARRGLCYLCSMPFHLPAFKSQCSSVSILVCGFNSSSADTRALLRWCSSRCGRINIMINLPPDSLSHMGAFCLGLEWELASGGSLKTHQTHNQTPSKHSVGHSIDSIDCDG